MNKITGIVLSSGHTNVKGKDMGASSKDNKYVEGAMTVLDKNILNNKLKEFGVKVPVLIDRDDTALAETMSFLKGRTKENDILIDIHYNASDNVTAKGTEVLIPQDHNSTELEIADKISDIIGSVLGTRERGNEGGKDGVKTEADSARKRLGWMRMTGINILIELEFLSNPDTMKVVESKRDQLWSEIAKYLVSL